MSPSILDILSSDILAEIVLHWIDGIETLGHLDIAIANRLTREHYFHTLSSLKHQSIPYEFKIKSESNMERCARWVETRSVYPAHLHLSGKTHYERTGQHSLKWKEILFQQFAPNLVHLRCSWKKFDITNFTADKFPSLQTLSLSGGLLKRKIKTLKTKVCLAGVKKLELEDYSDIDLKSMCKLCPNVTELIVKNERGYIGLDCFPEILHSLPNLQAVDLDFNMCDREIATNIDSILLDAQRVIENRAIQAPFDSLTLAAEFLLCFPYPVRKLIITFESNDSFDTMNLANHLTDWFRQFGHAVVDLTFKMSRWFSRNELHVDQVLKAVVRYCCNTLEHLTFADMFSLPVDFPFEKFSNLRSLSIENITDITDKQLTMIGKTICQSLPHCQTVKIVNITNGNITDEGFVEFLSLFSSIGGTQLKTFTLHEWRANLQSSILEHPTVQGLEVFDVAICFRHNNGMVPQFQNLFFPNLHTLRFHWISSRENEMIPILHKLIRGCPQLKNCNYYYYNGQNGICEKSLTPQQLRSLMLTDESNFRKALL